MRTAVAALALAVAACGEAVDVEPVGDYTAWGPPIEVRGFAPGHGDSVRRIYVNDVARSSPRVHPRVYVVGSIIVKEIYALDGDQVGDLRYAAIMRKLEEPASPLDDEAGWLFTDLRPGEDEKYFSLCWGRCHLSAPYLGAFYDYRD